MADAQFVTTGQTAVASTNKVLRNTYMLLSMTLLFSAGAAVAGMAFNVPHPGFIPWIIVTFGLLFAVQKTKNSSWGLLWTFAFTGFLGLTLAPILNMYMATSNGSSLIVSALSMTGFIFLSLSGYVLATKKDFSFMSGFLFAGMMVVIASIVIFFVAGYFFNTVIPGLSLAISAAIVLLMSGMILFQTSNIINGGETNYISATVSLYLSIYNIFIHLLAIFGVMDD